MAKTIQDFPVNGLSDKQFLVIAFEAVEYLGWRKRFISDAGVIAYTENGEHSWNGEITVKMEHGRGNIECASTTNVYYNTVQSEEYAVQQYIAAFEKLKGSISEDEINQKYKQYEKDFLPAYEDTLKPDTRPNFYYPEGFLGYFKPKGHYYVTPILIIINLLVFLVMVCTGVSVFEPAAEKMVAWGANSTITTLSGQWWRLLTNCFLHFGIMHLLLNMYALAFVGLLLEPFLGRVKFITAYLLTGLAASLASLWWHDYTISAGASGAIFGLYGVFLALLTTNHIEPNMRKGLLANIGIFVAYNLFYGSFKGGIDNAAHIGGLLSGAVIGYAFFPALKKPANHRLSQLTLTFTTLIVITGCAVSLQVMSKNDRVVYEKDIQQFYKIEERALLAVKDKDYQPNDVVVTNLNESIADWKSGIVLVQHLNQLKLSDKLHKRNELLVTYCQLRIQSCQMMSADIKQGASADNARLLQINQQLKSIIDQLRSR